VKLRTYSKQVPFCTSELTSHISKALYEEQVKSFSTPDGKLRSPTYEELKALPLLDGVIRETLRLHPPIHSIMRKVRDDVAVPASLSAPSKDGVYVVPKGHFVLACPAVSQVDPNVWKDAQTWNPSRWSDPEGVAAEAFRTYQDENGEKIDYGFGAVSKGTESPYQPFGAGRHRCIGEQVRSIVLHICCILTPAHSLRTSSWAPLSRPLSANLSSGLTKYQRIIIMYVYSLSKSQPCVDKLFQTMITMPKKPRTIYYRRRKFD
jgi:sterol 14-demethylase